MSDEENTSPGVYAEAQMFGQDFTAVFDDNGKVAYAFLLYQGEIITDVWLYNVAPTPEEFGLDQPPHLNPKGYARDEAYPRIEREDQVEFRFITPGEIRTLYVELHLRGEFFAKLVPDQVPGWSKWAAQDGDLALVLQ
jgi:hypothetical protein